MAPETRLDDINTERPGGVVLNRWKDRDREADHGTEETIDPGPESAAAAESPPGGTAGREAGPAHAGEAGADSTVESELAELKDRHLRLAAEFENFRKRTRKEAAAGRGLAQADLVAQLLPTLDDLARVADTPPEGTTVEALEHGIELILQNLRKQLEQAGLTHIEALDERFDPERHEAVVTTTVDDPRLDETVSRVFLDGYEFLGRLVRPARVEVRRYEEPEAADGEV